MTPIPTSMRHSELLACLVLDRNTTEDLGRVELLWMYPQVHRVLGFICKSGPQKVWLTNKRSAFTLAQITRISNNTLWVASQGTETDTTKVSQLESLIGHEVWYEGGVALGKIVDCLFDLKTGHISQYLVALKGWKGVMSELFSLAPSEIISFGRKRVLVSEMAAEEITAQQGRIQKTLSELQEDYRQLTEEIQSLSQQAQKIIQQTTEGFGPTVGHSFKILRENFTQVWQEEAQDWVDQGKGWAKQAKERVKDLRDQVLDNLDNLDNLENSDPLDAFEEDEEWGEKPEVEPGNSDDDRSVPHADPKPDRPSSTVTEPQTLDRPAAVEDGTEDQVEEEFEDNFEDDFEDDFEDGFEEDFGRGEEELEDAFEDDFEDDFDLDEEDEEIWDQWVTPSTEPRGENTSAL
jgi:uncharacterized protein YrrD